MPKNFVGELFCAVFQTFPLAKKIMSNRGGGVYQDFTSKTFCLTVPTSSVGKSFTVAKISRIEKVWFRGGGVSSFYVEKFLSHSAENFPWENPSLLQ